MAIEKVSGRVPPAAALLQEIERRRTDMAVKLSGLAPVLDMLHAYIAATEARIAALESRGDEDYGTGRVGDGA